MSANLTMASAFPDLCEELNQKKILLLPWSPSVSNEVANTTSKEGSKAAEGTDPVGNGGSTRPELSAGASLGMWRPMCTSNPTSRCRKMSHDILQNVRAMGG